MDRWHELALCFCLFLGYCAFKGCIGSKCPARTTSSLVFNFTCKTCRSEIYFSHDICILKSTSFKVVSIIHENAVGTSAFFRHFKRKKLLVFLRLEIGCPVVGKNKRVRIASLSSQLLFGVVLLNDVVVKVKPSLFLDEGFLIMHFFIVPGDEMEKGLVLAHCPSCCNTRAN